MKIAIASGKGGTGKTTVATNLAWVAARAGRDALLVDCDVEEPNCHLFLNPTIERTDAVSVEIPVVDESRCDGCGKCAQVCRFGAIISLQTKPLTFPDLCHSCAGCWLLCPQKAIAPQPMSIGEIDRGRSNGLELVSGRLNIGQIRSAPLIARLKDSVREAELILFDASPGTACPVVETLRNVDFVLLVTEPTPFGLNDLRLAVELVRILNRPMAVAINRDGIGDDGVESYCDKEGIEILERIPDDRRIAEIYSRGGLVAKELPEYQKCFSSLLEKLEERT